MPLIFTKTAALSYSRASPAFTSFLWARRRGEGGGSLPARTIYTLEERYLLANDGGLSLHQPLHNAQLGFCGGI